MTIILPLFVSPHLFVLLLFHQSPLPPPLPLPPLHAQVVYFLNSKNEDGQAVRAKEANAYEDEIQSILGDARRRITTYTKALESTMTKEHHEGILQSLTQTHKAARDKAMADYRKQLESKTVETVKKFAAQYDKRTSELVSIRQGLERRQKEMDTQRQKDVDAHAAEMTALRDGHNASIAHVRRELTAEAAAAMQSQIKSNVDAAKAAAARKLADNESDFAARLASVAKELKATKDAEAMGKKLAEKARAVIQQKHADRERDLQAELGRLKELQALGSTSMEGELKEALSKLADKTGRVTELEKQLEAERKKSTASAAAAAKSAADFRSAEEQAVQLRAELMAAAAAAKVAADDHAAVVAAKDKELSGIVDFCNSDRDSVEARLKEVETELFEAQEQLRLAQQGSRGSIVAAEKKFESDREKMQAEVAAANAELATARKRMNGVAADIRTQWDADRAKMVAAHQAELQAAAAAANGARANTSETDQVRAQAEAALAALRKQLAEVEAACVKAEAEGAALRKKLKAAADAENASAAEVARLTSELHAAATRTKALEGDARNYEVEQSKLAGLVASWEGRAADLATEIERLHAASASMQQELGAAKLAAESAEAQHSDATGAQSEMKRQHAAELRRLEDEASVRRMQLEGRIDDLNTEVVEIRAAHSKVLADLKIAESRTTSAASQLAAARSELELLHASKVQELIDAHTEEVGSLKQELAEANRTHADAMAELVLKHTSEMDAVRTSHDEEMAEAAYKHSVLLSKSQEEGKRTAEKTRIECEAEFATERDGLESHLAEQLAKQAKSNEEMISARVGSAMADAKVALAEELGSKERELSELRQHNESHTALAAAAKETIETAEAELDQLGKDMSTMRQELKDKGAEAGELKSEMLNKMSDREDELRDMHKGKMENLIQSYRDQFEKAKEGAAAQRAGLEAKVAIFTEELQNAQERFKSRPAREEDTARIDELEAEVEALAARAAQLQVETDRYKLEVQHQDKAFSQVFATGKGKGVGAAASRTTNSPGSLGRTAPGRSSNVPRTQRRSSMRPPRR